MNARGFSILEFMISISLGALLIGGLSQIFLSNKTSTNLQQGLARIQEHGRFLSHLLKKDIRMAGFQGCAQQSNITVTNLVQNTPYESLFDDPLFGYEGLNNGSWTPSLPASIAAQVKPGTDVIEIRKGSNLGVQLLADMVNSNNPLLVDNRLGIEAGDLVMVTDCTVGNIFRAGANTNATAITHTVSQNTSNDLSKEYQQDAQVMKFEYFIYYIKNSGRNNNANTPVFALYRRDINGNELEIAAGVEDMQIIYGVDTSNNQSADSFMSAQTVTAGSNWGNVVSVQLNLLVNSVDNVSTSTQVYTFNGEQMQSNDYRLRREWINYINLRNRGL